jgi:ATP-binding cassette, subfamily B, bacterial HlyB/CyaB
LTLLSPGEVAARYARLAEEDRADVAALLDARLTARAARVAPAGTDPAATPTADDTHAAGAIAAGGAASASSAATDGRALLGRSPLFESLAPAELDELAGRLTELRFGAGAFMTQQGAHEDWLFLLAEGRAEIRATVEGSNVTAPVGTLAAGDFFGEMSLLTGEPRRASVIAVGPARCYRLDRADFDTLLRARPAIVDALAETLGTRLAEGRAARQARLDLLGTLPEPERRALLRRLRTAAFAPGSLIVEQGAREAWMFLVTAGVAEVRIRAAGGTASRRVATMRAGDFFGEMAVLTGEPRRASVVARTCVEGYVLDAAALDEVLARQPALREPLMRLLADRLRENRRGRRAL